ncbi:hypothetical protein EW145_g3071 [Phellinidium pouzarii]|uniref:T6SS Phospholipase effector Tle1-like catalytic domain-containing protein n=1 Tax=Phellinidium pouzarii TaxID=167371 RepID=A0A4S4L8E7_9AGAM|nr:hypothetical protein EW145_g3071 [Phellinidium pouzarii]
MSSPAVTSPSSHLPATPSSSSHTPTPSPLHIPNLTLVRAQWPRPPHLSVTSNRSAMSTDTAQSLNTEYHGPVIPPYHDKAFRGRTLVLCFDGTGDQFDLDNSNIIQFFSVLKKGDQNRQLVYYQSGIGTYSIPQVATPLYSRTSKIIDLMFAKNLNHHVMSGYKFLMQNYKEGDKICIFGFSRGAYTARALAGMVHKVGLLPTWNEQQVPFAYNMYKSDNGPGWAQSVAFKRTFSIDVDIEFVGVWDTVASVGLIPSSLPFTKSNTAIKVFRHALSLDEHRVKFRPSIYQRITADEARRGDFVPPQQRLGTSHSIARGRRQTKKYEVKETRGITETKEGRGVKGGKDVKETKESKETNEVDSETTEGGAAVSTSISTKATKIVRTSTDSSRRSGSGSRSRALLGSIKRSARNVQEKMGDVVERVSGDLERSKDKAKFENEELSPDSERDYLEQMYLDRSRTTDILEVWFAGCHCDVGGGSVPNSTPESLARIPLRWMIRECFLARTGIQFEADRLYDFGLDPTTLYPRVLKRPDASDDSVPPPVPPERFVKDQMGETKHGARTDGTEGRSRLGGACTTIADEKKKASCAPPLPRERTKDISTDGTLVDYHGDGVESKTGEVLHVYVEDASIVEKIPPTPSDEDDALHGMPTLGASKESPAIGTTTASATLPVSDYETEADKLDACSPIYDQLKLAKYWWLLEYLPVRERMQLADGTWKKKWIFNRGRPRVILQDEPLKVHRSVKMRMDATDLKYMPRFRFAKEPVWVD